MPAPAPLPTMATSHSMRSGRGRAASEHARQPRDSQQRTGSGRRPNGGGGRFRCPAGPDSPGWAQTDGSEKYAALVRSRSACGRSAPRARARQPQPLQRLLDGVDARFGPGLVQPGQRRAAARWRARRTVARARRAWRAGKAATAASRRSRWARSTCARSTAALGRIPSSTARATACMTSRAPGSDARRASRLEQRDTAAGDGKAPPLRRCRA